MATPDPNDISRINRQIQEEINKLTGQTKRNWQEIYTQISQSNPSVEALKELLESVETTVENISGDLNRVSSTFTKIVQELKRGNKALQFQETLISRAAEIGRTTLAIRRGETYADASHIKSLQRQAAIRVDMLKNLLKSNQLDDEQKETIKDQIRELNAVQDTQNDILGYNEQINRELLLAPKLASAFQSVLSRFKVPDLGFKEAYEETMKLGVAAKASGAPFNALATYGKILGSNLMDAINPIGIATTLFQGFFNLLMNADKSIGDLAKGMNISYKNAGELRNRLFESAKNAGDLYANTKTYQDTLLAINQSLGTSAMLSDKELKSFTLLREKAGYTNEELMGIYTLTKATGGELDKNVASFAGTVQSMNAQNKLAINEKQLLKEVSKVSDAIKLSVGGTAKGLAEAAFKAKQFGISLEQADQISQGLLNFEESISNELSAELLTGKNLNYEKARLLALNGDIAGASAEILEQLGGSAEFANMNRIQQEAIAKSVGLSRDDLAKSLIEREALVKLGGKEYQINGKQATLQEYYNKLKADGLSQEEIAKQLGDEALAAQLDQVSVAENINALVAQLQESFLPIAQQLLPQIQGFLTNNQDTIMSMVGGIKDFALAIAGVMADTDKLKTIFYTISGIIGIITFNQLVKMATAFVPIIMKTGAWVIELGVAAAAATAANAAITFGAGALIIAGAVAGVIALIDSMRSSAPQTPQDGFAPSNRGPFTITDSFGATAITAPGDNLAISPNVSLTKSTFKSSFPEDSRESSKIMPSLPPLTIEASPKMAVSSANQFAPSTTNTTVNVNIENLIKEQQRTNELLIALKNKEGVIKYDSDIAGKNVNINSYTIQ